MKRILYIADSNSSHDINWIKTFSQNKEKYACYLLSERSNTAAIENQQELINLGIQLTEPIDSFSILRPISTFNSIRKYKQIVREIQPDYIHVLFATPHAFWTLFSNVKTIISLRGSDILVVIPELLNTKGIKSIYFQLLFKAFRKAFRKADFITGTSKVQLEMTHKHFGVSSKKMQLVRTGVCIDQIRNVDKAAYLPEILINKNLILSPRYLSPIYNINYQLDAIQALPKQVIDDYTFVFIIGKGSDSKYATSQIERLGQLNEEIGLNYICFEHLSQNELWAVMKQASLTLITPKSDGTPNSALEAMVCKCPVILSNLKYDKELFGNEIPRCDLTDNKTLTRAIEQILDHTIHYPIETISENVEKHGNREIEMKKIRLLYK